MLGVGDMALGPYAGYGSDRGDNTTLLSSDQEDYVFLEDGADTLNAQDNLWTYLSGGSVLVDSSEADIRARCEVAGGASVAQLNVGNAILDSAYVATCVAGSAPDSPPNIFGVGQQWGAQVAQTSAVAPESRDRVALASPELGLPVKTALERIGPNPGRKVVQVRFGIAGDRAQQARVAIYDIRGRQVTILADGPMAPGWHVLEWNGRVGQGLRAATGVYFLTFEAAEVRETRKIVWLD